MKRITLSQYMNALGNDPKGMAKVLGRPRQTIEYWIETKCTVEIMENGDIEVFSADKVLHQPQVRG